jgi:7-carboxy-7-deazaguanine synthase
MPDTERRYRIADVFYSLQGEGRHVGTPMVFVRFAGCNLACPFCDTDHAMKHHATMMQILNEIESVGPLSGVPVCLTGGEPLLQVDAEFLTGVVADLERPVHVETNGTIEISGALAASIDWITCSPKKGAPVKLNPKWVNEFKVLYPFQVDIGEVCMLNPTAEKYVQPLYSPDRATWEWNIHGAMLFCRQNPAWRLSLQTQRILDIP